MVNLNRKENRILRTNQELLICGCIVKYYETASGNIIKGSIQITDKHKRGIVLSNRQRSELVDIINEINTGSRVTEKDRKIFFGYMFSSICSVILLGSKFSWIEPIFKLKP